MPELNRDISSLARVLKELRCEHEIILRKIKFWQRLFFCSVFAIVSLMILASIITIVEKSGGIKTVFVCGGILMAGSIVFSYAKLRMWAGRSELHCLFARPFEIKFAKLQTNNNGEDANERVDGK